MTSSFVSKATPFSVRIPVTRCLDHKGFRLGGEGGASIVIVHDKDSTKPAAAMSIAVGSNNDPTDFPGLAHFCEHMLFMGTEKYPSEDAYDSAVTRSGGYSNAWTGSDVTTYYFTSGLDNFKELLEMFLEFFISPSFNTSAVDRELNAVHSEDEKNHSVDYWRIDELFKTLFKVEHPNARYGNGNLTTLKHEPEAKGLSVHAALRAFFAEYYVADKSCLVLYSPFTAEELMPLVEPILNRMKRGTPAPQSFLPRKQPPAPSSSASSSAITATASSILPPVDLSYSPLKPSALKKWFNVITKSKSRAVSLKWVLPFGNTRWADMPYSFASHLIGHEVKGSVIHNLRGRGWATELQAGATDMDLVDDDFINFSVTVTLTDEGLLHVPEVLYVVFQYFELMRREAVDVKVGLLLSSSDEKKKNKPTVVSVEYADEQNEKFNTTNALPASDAPVTFVNLRVPPPDNFEELKKEMQTVFEFSEVGGSDDYVASLSNKGAQIGSGEFCVAAGQFYCIPEKDSILLRAEAIQALEYLVVENCHVVLMAGDVETLIEADEKGAFVGNVEPFKENIQKKKAAHHNKPAERGGGAADAKQHKSKKAATKTPSSPIISTPKNSNDEQTASSPSSSSLLTTRFHQMQYTVGEIPEIMIMMWSAEALKTIEVLGGGSKAHVNESLKAKKKEAAAVADEKVGSDDHDEDDLLLRIPQPNPFLSEDFTLYGPPSERNSPPARVDLKDSYGYALIKRSEAHLFSIPKLYLLVNIMMPRCCDIYSSYYRNILKTIWEEKTTDTSYYAELSGISFEIQLGGAGFTIEFCGPSATLAAFAIATLNRLFTREMMLVREALFDRHHQKYALSIETVLEKQPSSLANRTMSEIYSPCRYGVHATIAAKEGICFANNKKADESNTTTSSSSSSHPSSYCEFVDNFFSNGVRLEVVVDGNMPATDTETYVKTTLLDPVVAVFASAGLKAVQNSDLEPYRDFYVPTAVVADEEKDADDKPKDVAVACSDLYLYSLPPFSKTNINAAALVHLYGGECSTSPERYPILEILGKLMTSVFFNTLRTNETLGYMVGSHVTQIMERQVVFCFSAQSAVAGAFYLYSRIHAFLDAFEDQVLQHVTQEEIDTIVAGSIQHRKMLSTSIREDGNTLFSDRMCPLGWNVREQEICVLETKPITRELLISLYSEVLSNNRSTPQQQQQEGGGGGARRRGTVILINSDALPEGVPSSSFSPSECGGVAASPSSLIPYDFSRPVQLPAKKDTSTLSALSPQSKRKQKAMAAVEKKLKKAKAEEEAAKKAEEEMNAKDEEDDASDGQMEEEEDVEENEEEEGEEEEENDNASEHEEGEEEEADGGSEAAAGGGGANVDIKLVMNTFETPTFVKFHLLKDKADALAHATVQPVPFL